MNKPELSDREKFDAVTYQQFKPDPPKQAKGIWRVVGFLIVAALVGLVLCVIFGQQ
jgi:hypothetical protein